MEPVPVNEEALSQANARLGAAKEDLRAANRRLDAANRRLDVAKEDLRAANGRLDAAKEDLRTAKEDLRTAKDDLRTANGRLDVANARLAETEKLLEEARAPPARRSSLFARRTRADSAPQTLSQLEARFARELADVELARTQVSVADARVVEAQTQVVEAQTQVVEAQTQMNIADARVVEAQTQVTAAESQVQSATDQVGLVSGTSITVRDFLQLPLPLPKYEIEVDEIKDEPMIFAQPSYLEAMRKKARSSTTSNSRRTMQHYMPVRTERWPRFMEEVDAFVDLHGDRVVKKPVEYDFSETNAFKTEKDFVLYWAPARDAVLRMLKTTNPESHTLHNAIFTTYNDAKTVPGDADEYVSYKNGTKAKTVVTLIGEYKLWLLEFETSLRLDEIVNLNPPPVPNQRGKPAKAKAVKAMIQTFSYTVADQENLVRYSYFTNYLYWVFLKRTTTPQGEETLLVSPWIPSSDARKCFAYITMQSFTDLDCAERKVRGTCGAIPEWVLDKKDDEGGAGDGGGGGGAGGGASNGHAASPQPPPPSSGSNRRSSRSSSAASSSRKKQPLAPREVMEMYPETTTKAFFGTLPLMWMQPYEILSFTDKSQTRRLTVMGQDIVMKLVDVHSAPKRTDFSEDDLLEMEWNEVRIYYRLRELQGKLIPRFLYHGSDFNQFWATAVTTYEGDSLLHLVEREGGDAGGLTQEMKEAAVHSLGELHANGVIHGDVELRNALWRSSDHTVLWIDFEMASTTEEYDSSEAFLKLARDEMTYLESILREVPTLTVPSSSSAAPLLPPPGDDGVTTCIPETVPSPHPSVSKHSVKRVKMSCKICPCG